jgi:tetratricopeptide (TPR) repeat protein
MQTDQIAYERMAESLLFLESNSEIELAVLNARRLDPTLLLQVMDQLASEAEAADHAADLALIRFVRSTIERAIDKTKLAKSADIAISSAEDLIHAAAQQKTALKALELFRCHKNLVGPELYRIFRSFYLTIDPSPNSEHYTERRAAGLKALCTLSLLVGDPSTAFEGNLFWAAYCRDTGAIQNAERRFERLQRHRKEVGDRLEAALHGARGALFDLQGNTSQAAECYAAALGAFERLSDAELSLPNALIKLAGAYRGLSRYSDALLLIDRSLAILAKYPRYSELVINEIRSRNFRGLLLEDLGLFDEGLAEYDQAAFWAESIGDRGRRFQAMSNGAFSFQKAGRLEAARLRLRDILRVVKEWGNPIVEGSACNNLGQILIEMGRFAEAAEAFGRALAVKIGGAPEGEATAMIGMSDALRGLGDEEAARGWHTMALLPLLESGNLSILAQYVSRLPDDCEELVSEAIGQLKMGIEIARKTHRPSFEALFGLMLSQRYLKRGEFDIALDVCTDCLVQAEGREAQAPQALRLKIMRAQVLAAQAKKQEAYELLVETADQIEQRVRMVAENSRRSEVIAQWGDVYGTLLDLLVRPDDNFHLPDGGDRAERAFHYCESAKSRTFVSALAGGLLQAPPQVDQKLREEEARLLELERDFQAASPHEGLSERQRLERLKEIQGALSRLWAAMSEVAPDYVRLRSAEPISVGELRELVSGAVSCPMAFASFYCDDEKTTTIVLRSDDWKVRTFQSSIGRKKLGEAALALRRKFNGDPAAFPPIPPIRSDKPVAQGLDILDELGAALLGFTDALQGIELLCVAPHGPLHLLPVHALRDAGGRYLVERFAVTYCSSLSSLAYSLRNAPNGDATRQATSVFCAGVASRDDERLDLFEQDEEIFKEAGWSEVTTFSGLAATSDRIRPQLATHDVVHLTCHGYFDINDPLRSGVLLSDGTERPPRAIFDVSPLRRADFILSAKDMLGEHVSTKLVTLRACSTGLQSERNSGDEFDGLSRALVYAGSSATILSLWNVDQASSKEFLARFYRLWQSAAEPLEKWQAFAAVQRSLLQHSSAEHAYLRHPYHWAPMALSGDWR